LFLFAAHSLPMLPHARILLARLPSWLNAYFLPCSFHRLNVAPTSHAALKMTL
jgi:hypothetical protein